MTYSYGRFTTRHLAKRPEEKYMTFSDNFFLVVVRKLSGDYAIYKTWWDFVGIR